MGLFALLLSVGGIMLALWSLNEPALMGAQLASLSTAAFALAAALGIWRGVEVLQDIYMHTRAATPLTLQDEKFIAGKQQQKDELAMYARRREERRGDKRAHPAEFDGFPDT